MSHINVAATSTLLLRVYYEDTDAAEIVCYENYFRFIEQRRDVFVQTRGPRQSRACKLSDAR